MLRTISFLVISAFVGFVSPVFAEPSAGSNELTEEQKAMDARNMGAMQLYFIKGCYACHGLQGEGVAPKNGPQLAGLSESYLARQLMHFRERVRGGDFADVYGRLMTQAANSLTDEHITLLAELISGLQPRVETESYITGDAERGGQLYAQHCASCHADNGEGAETGPRLAGQQADYLALQMRNYQNGIRGTDPADIFGLQMAASSNVLRTEQDIVDVSVYLGGLQNRDMVLESKDNADVVLNFYKRLDGGDKSVIYELLDPNVIYHFPTANTHGPNEYWAFVSQAGIYIPDYKHYLTNVRISEEDPSMVMVGEIDVRGTTAAGEAKAFPSQDARYKVVNGKIAEAWIN